MVLGSGPSGQDLARHLIGRRCCLLCSDSSCLDQGDYRVNRGGDGVATISPARVGIGSCDHHGRVGFEQKNIAISTQSEIDAGLVEAKRVPDCGKTRHRLVAEHAPHVAEKCQLFLAMIWPVGHVGREVMHLPIP